MVLMSVEFKLFCSVRAQLYMTPDFPDGYGHRHYAQPLIISITLFTHPQEAYLFNNKRPMAPTSNLSIQPCTHLTPYSVWTNSNTNIKYLIKFGSPT
jgi:hypothetical protein